MKNSKFPSWRHLIFAAALTFLPSWAMACPRCLQATPYKSGLLLAVLFLLPIPFVLAGLLITWVIRRSKAEFPPVLIKVLRSWNDRAKNGSK